MPQRKESEVQEAKTKDVVEHAYNAGVSVFSAMRAMMPKVPANSRMMKEFRNAQKELLLAARSFIDTQILFLENLEKVSRGGQKKEEIKRVNVKQRK